MNDTASVVFTLDELWLLRSVVRHEMQGQEMWKFPIASLELNDQIAETILRCAEQRLEEAALLLSRGDTLLLDAVVPQDAKNARGIALGMPVLLKTFRARRDLVRGVDVEADEESPVPPRKDIEDAIARADRLEQQRARRAARRKAKE